MKPDNPPLPEYAFAYKNKPKSGNEINGLGSPVKRRARHIFHGAGGNNLDWFALDEFFSYISSFRIVRHILANVWQLRRQNGVVNPDKRTVADPDRMARDIKEIAKELGADVIGITRLDDDALYEGHQVPFKYAICLGLAMDRTEMSHVPQERAGVEVMRAYHELGGIAVKVGERIRALGWPARAYGNPNSTDLLHIPLAIQAGLGQLGKHGSLISREFGSNLRLAAVLTDLPMATDAPVDIGVEDVCVNCRRCVLDCPPGALFDKKQLVRGELKWYVDFDKCIPYFVKTYGCAICIEVCPWSEPGRGTWLFEKMMARRKQQT